MTFGPSSSKHREQQTGQTDMSNNETTTKDTPDTSADSDGEEIFHDARFPPEEEKVRRKRAHIHPLLIN